MTSFKIISPQARQKQAEEYKKLTQIRSDLMKKEKIVPEFSNKGAYKIMFLGFVKLDDEKKSMFYYSTDSTDSTDFRAYELQKDDGMFICVFLFNVSNGNGSILFKPQFKNQQFSLDKAEKYDNLDKFVETKEPHKFLFKKSVKKSVKKSAKKVKKH